MSDNFNSNKNCLEYPLQKIKDEKPAMCLLFNYKNVYLDQPADHDLETIVERKYISELFVRLEKNLEEKFSEFEFHVLFSHNPSVIPVSYYSQSKNKVLFWFSDESGVFPSHLVNNYTIIFKSHIQEESLNVYSNPLGYVNEFDSEKNTKIVKKDIDIFFAGNLNGNRRELYRVLFFRKFKFLKFLELFPNKILNRLLRILNVRNLSYRNNFFFFSSAFKSGLRYNEYYHYLLRSKFIICPRGFYRSETFRHYESLHTGGIIISEEMPNVSIYKDNPFLVYRNKSELNKILSKIEREEYDETMLKESHRRFYCNNFNSNTVSLKISDICKRYLKDT